MSSIIIQMASAPLYEEILRIYNEGFLPKFRFVSERWGEDCAHDFGILDLSIPARYFVAVEEDEILGIIVLKGVSAEDESFRPHLSFVRMLRKYGPAALLRLLYLGWINSYRPPAGELYVDSISVSSSARGKGVGTKLLAFAERFAAENGCSRISLEVMFENGRARSLYERVGYRITGTTKFPFLNKRFGYSGSSFMVKDLSAL